MTSYSLVFKPSVEKDFRCLSHEVVPRLTKKVEELRTNPFPHQAERLSGAERLYRIRIGD